MLEIKKGLPEDVDELAALYDALTDYLDSHVNYPGWKKGVYPTREDAIQGVEEGSLFVARDGARIAGSLMLRHKPEPAYALADWHVDLAYSDIFIIHTFAVHPRYLHRGIGKKLLEFVFDYAARTDRKAVRLDVHEKNLPAIKLYETFGFQYIDTVDLGYGVHGLDWFKLYQYLL